jgi:predicted  nucleic acid-binding Zn-ribbon protein
MATYVNQAAFDEHRDLTEGRLDIRQERLDTLEDQTTDHSIRLSREETQTQVMRIDVQRLEAKIDAAREEFRFEITDLRTEVRAGFAKIEAQLREIRHILMFLVKENRIPLPPMPAEEQS